MFFSKPLQRPDGPDLVAVVLTGANSDGSAGLKSIL